MTGITAKSAAIEPGLMTEEAKAGGGVVEGGAVQDSRLPCSGAVAAAAVVGEQTLMDGRLAMAAAAIPGEIGEIPVLVTAFAPGFKMGAVEHKNKLVVAEAEAGSSVFAVVAVDADGAVSGGVQVEELGLLSLVALEARFQTQFQPIFGMVAITAFYGGSLVIETVADQAE